MDRQIEVGRVSQPCIRMVLSFVSCFAAILFIAITLTSCIRRVVAPPSIPNESESSDYVDLKPGWRLRVTTPILKSGGFLPVVIDGRLGADFVGYETSYYKIKQNQQTGMSITLSTATVTMDGKTSLQAHPIKRLFALPEGINYVRLIYTINVSQADHGMALLGASEIGVLNSMTENMRETATCHPRPESRIVCLWIPSGIAVVPEIENGPVGNKRWIKAP